MKLIRELNWCIAIFLVFALACCAKRENTTVPNDMTLKETSEETIAGNANEIISYDFALEYLKDNELISSEFDNVSAEQIVTRAEFLKIICQQIDFDNFADTLSTDKYTDVPLTHWVNKYVAFALELNIFEVNEKNFSPNEPILFNDALKIIICAYGNGDKAEDAGGTFKAYKQIAGEMGLLDGINCNADSAVDGYTLVMLLFNLLYTNQ